MRVRRFALPRSDSGPGEYEDASWPDVDDTVTGADRVRLAVADGAAESLLAGPWARLLVATAVDYDSRSLRRAVHRAAGAWPAEVARWLDGREPAWWQLEKLGRGAHATLLTVQYGHDGRWRAAAVGDSCLLHVRGGRVCRAFPVDAPDGFGVRPELVGSADPERCRPVYASGVAQPGDRLLLATDAVAAHALAEGPAELLDAVDDGGAAAFADWAEQARKERTLRDDDLTLLVLDR